MDLDPWFRIQWICIPISGFNVSSFESLIEMKLVYYWVLWGKDSNGSGYRIHPWKEQDLEMDLGSIHGNKQIRIIWSCKKQWISWSGSTPLHYTTLPCVELNVNYITINSFTTSHFGRKLVSQPSRWFQSQITKASDLSICLFFFLVWHHVNKIALTASILEFFRTIAIYPECIYMSLVLTGPYIA